MAIANTDVFGNHLDKDVDQIFFDDYAMVEPLALQIAHVMPAPPGNHFIAAELSPFGPLKAIDEGDAVTFDVPVEGHKKTVYYSEYGLGFTITKHMYRDDLTGNWKRAPSKLSKSAKDNVESKFFDLFNNGFGTHTAWDEQYVFDTDHSTLYSGETITNDPTAASLTETTLRAMFEYFEDLIDEAGMPIPMHGPKTLLVPTELMWTANQLLQSTQLVGSANNDLNMVNPQYNVIQQWRVVHSPYLTSSTAYFLLDNENHGFHFMWKDPLELKSADDFYTDSALFKVTQRYATFVLDYKGQVGNSGA